MGAIDWTALSQAAWAVRENARLIPGGKTKVGAAILDERGAIHVGCNVQHSDRCHDFHAETSAVDAMACSGARYIRAIIIVAEREDFTPCGSCTDWIVEFSSPETFVGTQSRPDAELKIRRATEFRPHYEWARASSSIGG